MPKKPTKPTKSHADPKSPNNNRKITASKKSSFSKKLLKEWKLILASFLIGVALMLIIFLAADSYRLYEDVSFQKEKREAIFEDIARWEDVVKNYPDYRDGYYSLSLLYFRIKDKKKALFYLDRALEIDPNFTMGRNLRGEILSK